MREPEGLDPGYVAVWRPILTGWLGWSGERFDSWVTSWDYKIRNVKCHRLWFYHEDELEYVLRLMVPDELAHRLEKQRTRRMNHDLNELLYEEIGPAITGRPNHPSWGTDAFDWEAAKDRVEAVLQRYEVSIPGPSEVTSYEKRILEADQD
jgi:hypothetical protein